jgi:hypothetical protein
MLYVPAAPALIDSVDGFEHEVAVGTLLRPLVERVGGVADPPSGGLLLVYEIREWTVHRKGCHQRSGHALAHRVETGHGGGFVFDCRALPNPGREKQFVRFTGRDTDCAAWLAARPEVSRFMEQSRALVMPAVATYRERNFTHLSVAFGCTGGQHRSVWCAEQLAAELRSAGVRVDLRHRDMPEFTT